MKDSAYMTAEELDELVAEQMKCLPPWWDADRKKYGDPEPRRHEYEPRRGVVEREARRGYHRQVVLIL